MAHDHLLKVPIFSAEELRNWLAEHHGRDEGVWLVTFKKAVPDKYVSNGEVLDELLAYGWMDGRRLKLDEQRTMQLISPRRAEHWSKTYKDRVARLEAEGRMAEPGRAAVRSAQKSGAWNFLDDVDNLIQPDDLREALANNVAAHEFFNGLSASRMRFALRWLKLAKTEKTRQKRIGQIVELSAAGKRVPGS